MPCSPSLRPAQDKDVRLWLAYAYFHFGEHQKVCLRGRSSTVLEELDPFLQFVTQSLSQRSLSALRPISPYAGPRALPGHHQVRGRRPRAAHVLCGVPLLSRPLRRG